MVLPPNTSSLLWQGPCIGAVEGPAISLSSASAKFHCLQHRCTAVRGLRCRARTWRVPSTLFRQVYIHHAVC